MRRILKLGRQIRVNPPRHTVRLRLTLLYGVLFLIAGAALLAITYVLVVRSTIGSPGMSVGMVIKEGDGSAGGTAQSPNIVINQGAPNSLSQSGPLGLTPSQAQVVGGQLYETAQVQHNDMLHQFLVQSGIALAIMAALSVALGWLAAGRILRPVRTIISSTRQISASSLHERLNLRGPHDELKELGDTIDALLARLEATFQAQRQFIANASHELRSPLARQRVLSQVALADPEATVESLKAAHERVLVSGDQQNQLIEALLALARGQAGLSTRIPFDLADVVGAALVSRRAEAGRQGLVVEADLGAAMVDGSAQLAERLVVNLLDNAIRHNVPEGGRIIVTTGMEQGRAVITVANTGSEIPAADVARLTRPFQRLGASRLHHPRTGAAPGYTAADGLGLGLSIVEAVANAHGAAVELCPRLAGGLIVHVRFPVPRLAPVARPSAKFTGRS